MKDKDLTLHNILSSHMLCILALFRNVHVHHRFDKSIPQFVIPKPTWNFVQGKGSKLNLTHKAQRVTVCA
jgi:hypothetical protein